MFKSYLIVAFRGLKKRKVFSIINILCLSLGITFSLLIGVYILKERDINTHLRNADNHYLIKSKWKVKNTGLDITTIGPLAKTMKEEYPSLVSNYYRYNPVTNVVSAGDNYFKENIAIGDTTLISMYGFPLLYGNVHKPFQDNNSAVITESMAIKLYGKKNAINQRLSIQTVSNEKQDYLVSAVLKDIPYNSVTGLVDDNYNVFVPTIDNRYYQGGDPSVSWNSIYEVGFIELKDGVNPSSLQEPFRKVLEKYAQGNIKNNLEIELAPVKDYYIKVNNGAAKKMITTLALIGGFILLMAIINFINISIGTSPHRLMEIGIRKVLGGRKRQLIWQFLSESLLLTFFAGIISLIGYTLLRPVFNQLLNTTISDLTDFGLLEIGFYILFLLSVGLIAGFYPAIILSSSDIVFSVKGKMASPKSGSFLRKSLLIVQFTLMIIVFIGALSVSRQVFFIFNKDLGYNKEQLLVVTAFPKQWDSTGILRMERIKQQLFQIPAVKDASLTFEVPDRKPPSTISLLPVNGSNNALSIPTINVDEDYAATCGMKMVDGTFFNNGGRNFISGQIVLNETAAKALGIDIHSAVGKQVNFSPAGSGEPLTVAGIVKDYNYSNIQEGIEPLVFTHVKDFPSYRFLTLRLQPGDINQTIAAINEKWKQASPGSPFEYFFMDEKFQSLYSSELRLKRATYVATLVNLLIVLMGIFGVVAFTLSRRNKEIAVRKVLGANVGSIIRLFLKEYGVTILIANAIAWPSAYTLINSWLENYNYRIEQDMFSYLLVGFTVFFIAFLLIALQCFKAASANPVKSLRTE